MEAFLEVWAGVSLSPWDPSLGLLGHCRHQQASAPLRCPGASHCSQDTTRLDPGLQARGFPLSPELGHGHQSTVASGDLGWSSESAMSSGPLGLVFGAGTRRGPKSQRIGGRPGPPSSLHLPPPYTLFPPHFVSWHPLPAQPHTCSPNAARASAPAGNTSR